MVPVQPLEKHCCRICPCSPVNIHQNFGISCCIRVTLSFGMINVSCSKMVAECSSGISKYRLDCTASLSAMLVIFIPIAVRIPTPTHFRITHPYLELTYVGLWTDRQVVPVNHSFMKDYHKIVISQTIEPFQFVFCWTVTEWWLDHRPSLK